MTPQSNIQQKEQKPIDQFAGFWPLIEKEVQYENQCALTPIWY
jgi:hypothetical protein